MKTLITICTFLFLISFSSFSQVLLNEQFDYPLGTELTSVGWTAHNGGTTNPIFIVPTTFFVNYPPFFSANAASLTSSGQDINHILSDTNNYSGTLYAAIVVSVQSAQTTGDYFFHFMENSSDTSGFGGRLYVKLASNGKYSFGISKGPTDTPVYGDSVYNSTFPILLVVKYTINPDTLDDVAELFTLPGYIEKSENLISTTTSSASKEPDHFGAVALRQGSSSSAANVTIEVIRVAKTWSEISLNNIASLRQDNNADNQPDFQGGQFRIKGVVISPNFETDFKRYYVWDGTAGIAVALPNSFTTNFKHGDIVDMFGVLTLDKGLLQLSAIHDSLITIVSDSNIVPQYQQITMAQFKANPEEYESELVAFESLNRINGTWPAEGEQAELLFSDGIDTITVLIDSESDIDGKQEPAYPIDIAGIISQNSTNPHSGYKLIPRYYAQDFNPGGTIPVELSAFNASFAGSAVKLEWKTATETNNRGFEVQRRSSKGNFETISFVAGNGTTTEQRLYSYSDNSMKKGTNIYRLKQIDLNGSFNYSTEVGVDVNIPAEYSLDQNYPNPFNPTTNIRFTLSADAKVTLKLFNILGQEVATLLNNNYVAGAHEFSFNASNQNSGVYFYKIVIIGIDGSSYTSVKKMTLTK